MRAIVTGADGFIGSAVVNELVKNNIEVLAIDLSFNSKRIIDDELVSFLICDIKEISKLKLTNKFDLFYQFAWDGSAGEKRSNIDIQISNALTTVDCLKFANKLGCKKFISAGSIMEFEANEAIYAQETSPSVNYIYGIGKSLAHMLCKTTASQLDIDLVWAYITNAYGPHEKSPRFINNTLRKIINNEQLEFTSATQNYDFIYIDDVARAFVALGLNGRKNKNYVIGSGNAKPLKEFILEMTEDAKFGDIKFTGTNLDLSVFSIEEIKKDCSFIPKIPFKEGIEKTKQWLKENQ